MLQGTLGWGGQSKQGTAPSASASGGGGGGGGGGKRYGAEKVEDGRP